MMCLGLKAVVIGKVTEAWIDEPGRDDDLAHIVVKIFAGQPPK